MSRTVNSIDINDPTGFALGNATTRSTLTSVGDHAINLPAASGDLFTVDQTVALTNKTLTDESNNVAASSLFSDGGDNIVDVRASPNPTAGQVLTAVDGTNAVWQDPSSPGTSQTTGTVTTVNATPTTIETFTIPEDGAVFYITSNIAALAINELNGAGIAAGYTIKATYRKSFDESGPIRVGPVDDLVAFEDDSGFNVFTTVVGNDILLQVVGDAIYQTNWRSATTRVIVEQP